MVNDIYNANIKLLISQYLTHLQIMTEDVSIKQFGTAIEANMTNNSEICMCVYIYIYIYSV
jgi:hypothetical protein